MRLTDPRRHDLSTCSKISIGPLPPTGAAATFTPKASHHPPVGRLLPPGPAAAVDDVFGVEAEVDVGRVGGVEDAADFFGGLGVGVAVGVQDHLQPVFVEEHLSQGVGLTENPASAASCQA